MTSATLTKAELAETAEDERRGMSKDIPLRAFSTARQSATITALEKAA